MKNTVSQLNAPKPTDALEWIMKEGARKLLEQAVSIKFAELLDELRSL